MVHNVGINDMGRGWRTQNELNERIYRTWSSMLQRCYSKEYQKKYPTYKGCFVCEKWLKLSGFVEDVCKIDNYELWLKNPNKRISLDKDIKSNNKNKCYCLQQCKFVSNEDNIKQSRETTNYSFMKGENNFWYNKKRNDLVQNNKLLKSKKVSQYDLNGNLIRIWNSMSEVKRELNFDQGKISNCCIYYEKGEEWWKENRKGKPTKKYKGHVWKYYEG